MTATIERRSFLRTVLAATFGIPAALLTGPVPAAETLKLGTLKFGTVNWLLDTIAAERLDEKHGVAVERVELASNQALTIALQSGEVDLIVSDWLWAMRQRAESEPLAFAPYSSALGALMAPRDKPLSLPAGLKGRRIGVAGSALDKSWLLLRAYARGPLGGDLATLAEPIYGAPPLLSEQLKLGRLDAVLTYWPFAARLDAAGFVRILDVADVMTALGIDPPPPLVGFVWRETLGERKGAAVAGFFGAVTDANRILKESDPAWERLKPAMKAESQAEFERLRDYFRAGVPGPWGEAETRAAERLFRILEEVGGPALVGPRTRFDPALFRTPRA